MHRDLKPSNVLVTPESRVVILDFELSKRHGSQTVTGHGLSGTPAHMAPEQIRETNPRPASDWYAVGVMLFETLPGRLPFDGPMLDVLLRKQSMRPPSPQTLDPEADHALSQLCLELLDPNPDARPGGDSLLERLDQIQRTSVVPEVQQARSPSPSRSTPAFPPTPSNNAAHFVGRTRELARLHAAMEQPRQGKLCAAVVAGGSGLGKTALLDRFLTEATEKAQGRTVVALRRRTAPPWRRWTTRWTTRCKWHKREAPPPWPRWSSASRGS